MTDSLFLNCPLCNQVWKEGNGFCSSCNCGFRVFQFLVFRNAPSQVSAIYKKIGQFIMRWDKNYNTCKMGIPIMAPCDGRFKYIELPIDSVPYNITIDKLKTLALFS